LEKKKLTEEWKKKLDELKKTTRELAKASNKQKVIILFKNKESTMGCILFQYLSNRFFR